MKKWWLFTFLIISNIFSVVGDLQAADEKYSIIYRFSPHQVLSYRENVNLEMTMGAKSITTLNLNRAYALSVVETTNTQTKLLKAITESQAKGTKMGESASAETFNLPKVGAEVSFVTDSRGHILSPYQPGCAMAMEDLPAQPVAVGDSWNAVENNGTVHSQYTLVEIIKKNDQTTYYLIRGKHQRHLTETTTDPNSGAPVRLITDTQGNSWIYFVGEWGQILSAEYKETGTQTITQGTKPNALTINLNFKQDAKIQLEKIAR